MADSCNLLNLMLGVVTTTNAQQIPGAFVCARVCVWTAILIYDGQTLVVGIPQVLYSVYAASQCTGLLQTHTLIIVSIVCACVGTCDRVLVILV